MIQQLDQFWCEPVTELFSLKVNIDRIILVYDTDNFDATH